MPLIIRWRLRLSAIAVQDPDDKRDTLYVSTASSITIISQVMVSILLLPFNPAGGTQWLLSLQLDIGVQSSPSGADQPLSFLAITRCLSCRFQ
jgi:hypothetical protein